MPDEASIRKDAELVVDVCMTVEKDDVVTIITDDEHSHEAHVVAEVCMEREAWPVVMNNEMQVRRGLADTLFPMAPPQNLHQAMTHSDEVIIITNLEWANRFAHNAAVKETVANNGKIASVEPGMGEWGLTLEMLHAARQRAQDAMKALEGVEKGRVGTVHCALGDNHSAYPGGQNVCKLHLDGVVLDATLQVVDDGRYIIKDGQWAL